MPRPHALRGLAPGLWVLAVLVVLAAAAALLAPAAATAQGTGAPSAAEVALAERYAPVVRLREEPDLCTDDRVPFVPIDVDLLMGNDEIALRGPWDRTNLISVAPTARELARGLWDYHLDFPGDALDPGCTYEEWAARLQPEAPPTTYARVVTEAGYPDQLALQYWFFYVFNDWNNTHEGDWEMIQLLFDASTPEQALATQPVQTGYSQHSSAESADWDDAKVQKVDGTHPVVHPAAGSHANFYDAQLYLMRSNAEGVGCDDARGPSTTLRPVVRTVPTEPSRYLVSYPWLGFDGRWGEQQTSFFNGPTGPNEKTQWTKPITWSRESWRADSFQVPAAGVNTHATDFFCGAVAAGSEVLRQLKVHPGRSLLVVGGLAVLLMWALARTRWIPSTPLRVPRRRAWGQEIAAAGLMLWRHPRTFFGIGLLFVPIGIIITLFQYMLFQAVAFAPLVDEAGQQNAFVDAMAIGFGLLLTFLGFGLMQAATAWALVQIDEGREPRALDAYRAVLQPRRLGPLAGALCIAVIVQVVLDLTVVLLPVAVYIVVWWSMLAVSGGVEGSPRPGPLRRSAALVRGNWWRVAAVCAVVGAALFVGPAVGVLVLLFTGAAFNVVNLIASVVYLASLPFAGLLLTYTYFDLRVRHEEAGGDVVSRGELPSELDEPITPPDPAGGAPATA